MGALKKIWNWRPDPALGRSVKIRAARGLFLLLSLMLCCTLVSRAASTMTIPVVTVKAPARRTLTHTVTAQGKVESADSVAVLGQDNVLVNRVYVEKGDYVEAGQLLFTFDVDEVAHQISQKRLERERLQAELKSLEESREYREELAARGVEQAEMDYDYADERANQDVQAALDELNTARRALTKYGGPFRDYDNDEDYDYDEDLFDFEYETLRSAYRDKKRLYEQALKDREERLRTAERAVYDAQEPTEPNAQAELLGIDIQMKDLEISQLQETLAGYGQVYAPVSGVVSTLEVEAGKRTGGGAALRITGEEGFRFVAQISKEEEKHVARGDPATIKFAGETKATEGFVVDNVTAKGDGFQVELLLPADMEQELDTTGTLEVKQQTRQFDTVLPLSALRSDGPQAYVLVVRDTESPLGEEQMVERFNVAVEDRNESFAAANGSIPSDAQVVVDCEKPLADGDRVRVGEVQ